MVEEWWTDKDYEKAIRHSYVPSSKCWTSDSFYVKLDTKPFTRGAVKQAYYAKLIPIETSIHQNGDAILDWTVAQNFIVKSYNTDDGRIDVNSSRNLYFDNVQIQHEVQFWADKFNSINQSDLINLIPIFALELCDRPNSPVVICENVFHNVDMSSLSTQPKFIEYSSSTITENIIPQLFFIYTLFASNGNLMVVHLEGYQNLFTNPQIHSISCLYGSTDYGKRGMALFFATFNCISLTDRIAKAVSSSSPMTQHGHEGTLFHARLLTLYSTFLLSRKEEERIAKQSKQKMKRKSLNASKSKSCMKLQLSDEDVSQQSSMSDMPTDIPNCEMSVSTSSSGQYIANRSDILSLERKLVSNSSFSIRSVAENQLHEDLLLSTDEKEEIQQSIFRAYVYAAEVHKDILMNSGTICCKGLSQLSITGEVVKQLTCNCKVCMNVYSTQCGAESDAVIEIQTSLESIEITSDLKLTKNNDSILFHEKYPAIERQVVSMCDDSQFTGDVDVFQLQSNLSQTHLELAVLEAVGHFSSSSSVRFGNSSAAVGVGGKADISSCIFHLCEACRFGSCEAALSLARLHYGLSTDLLHSLGNYITKNSIVALKLFMLAAHRGSIAALYYSGQMLQDSDDILSAIVWYRFTLHALQFDTHNIQHNIRANGPVIQKQETNDEGVGKYCVGDIVEVNYYGCGSWYLANITEVLSTSHCVIAYVDGGEVHTVQVDHVRCLPNSSCSNDSDGISQIDELQKSDDKNCDVFHGDNNVTNAISSEVGINEDKKFLSSDTSVNALLISLHGKGIGSDDDIAISIHEILAMIGQLYLKLGDCSDFELEYMNSDVGRTSTRSHEQFNYFAAFFPNDLNTIRSRNELISVGLRYYNEAYRLAIELGKMTVAESYNEILCSDKWDDLEII